MCAFVFSFEALQTPSRISNSFKNNECLTSTKKSLVGTAPCSNPGVCNDSMEQSSLRKRWRAQPSLLGLQLGGGKVSRMEWECKQTAHSTGSCWQEKGFPGKGRENEGLQRKAKRKPHEVLFQKNTEVRLVLQVPMGSAVSCRKCCHPEQHDLFYFNVNKKMQANISTSTNIIWGKYIVLVLLQGSVLQQRGQLEFN